MFDIFTAAHSEQRAALYEGSEYLSLKTANIMLSRLGTGYYNSKEEARATYVLTKLGHLKNNQFNNNNDDSLLEKANDTIRKANNRIHELKVQLSSVSAELEELKFINGQLRDKLVNEHCTLTDMDILGYQIMPESSDLKKRYRNLAAIHHPDKGGSNVMMQRLNESYENLKTK